MDFSGPPSGLIFGADCVEVGTGEPMCFSAPTADELDASVTPRARREQAAVWLFDQWAAGADTAEVASLAERLCYPNGTREN